MHSSSFILDTGKNPQLGTELLRESCLETLNDFASQMEAVMKKHTQPFPGWQTTWPISTTPTTERLHYTQSGTRFGSKKQNIMTMCLMKNLDHKWLGLYAVDKIISQNAYRLKLPSSFG